MKKTGIKNYRDIVLLKMHETKGVCPVCNKPITAGQPQLAHIIEKSKVNVKKYGIDAIDHPINLVLVCSLRCNSSVLIGKSKKVRIDKHISNIRENVNEDSEIN